MSACSIAAVYPRNNVKNPSVYQAKRTTLCIIGASVAWGDGLDQTTTYASLIQTQLDTHVSTPLGGWTPRSIHTDDLMEAINGTPANNLAGACNASPNPTDIPFNGACQLPNFGAGPHSSATLNPDCPGQADTLGRSKLNYFDNITNAAPVNGAAGIFNSYGGTDKVSGGFKDPMIRFNAANQTFRWRINSTGSGSDGFFFIAMCTGSGVLKLQNNWGGAFPNVTFSTGQVISGPFFPTIAPPQTMSLLWQSGSVDITAFTCIRAQAVNHTLMQVCARNSYCLPDFIGHETDIVNSLINNPGSFSSPPVFVLFDSYNSMLQLNVATSRAFNPHDYVGQLKTFAQNLVTAANTAYGTNPIIILTMPIPTQETVGGPYIPVGSSGTWPKNGPWYWDAWRDQIANLAFQQGWGFIDQWGTIPCQTASNFYWTDQLHPQPGAVGVAGVGLIADQFIKQLSL